MNPLSACAFGVACAILISVIRHLRPEYASAAAAVAGAAVEVSGSDVLLAVAPDGRALIRRGREGLR